MKEKLIGITATAVVGVIGSAFFATDAAAESINVKSGDTLWSLSKEYGTTVQAIKDENGLSSDELKVGQTIKIPGAKDSKSDSVKNENRTVLESSSAEKNRGVVSYSNETTYIVQAGDTLWKVARNHNVTVDELKSLNNLNSELIMVGQKLVVGKGAIKVVPNNSRPSNTSSNNASSNNTNSSNTNTSSNNNPVVQSSKDNNGNYKVQRGDTLWKIANKFNVSVAEIKVINKLKTDSIYFGQTLSISGEIVQVENDPVVEEKKPANNNEGTSTPTPSSNSSLNVDRMISEAKALSGIPYRWGGNTPSGFDCSGFIYYVLNKVTSVSRLSAAGYWDSMKPVNSPAVGDFVYFSTYKEGPSHMGIYLGNNEFIHASSSGVTITSLNNSYWKQRYLGARQFAK